MKTIAFHGDFSSAENFKRDTGIPEWTYWDWTKYSLRSISNLLDEPCVLVGYSRGGALIGQLSNFNDNIVGAVLYESPIIPVKELSRDYVGGDFPILWIENMNGRRWRRKRFYDEMEDSKQKWSFDREVIEVIGMGRHTKFVWGWPPIGHGWDQELNVLIRNWVSRF
jgi:hypothetical protein